MGQMTMAVMLAVDAGEPPESLGDDGWYCLLEKYNPGDGPTPAQPYGDDDDKYLIGFWIAVGASGEDGCPDLSASVPLDDFLGVPEYKKSHGRAKKAWKKFAAWAASQGHTFSEPRVWLVQTEVA